MTEVLPLPMTARVTKISALPGLPSTETYAVVNGALFAKVDQDIEVAGYVVQLSGKRKALPLAVISTSMKAYAVNAPDTSIKRITNKHSPNVLDTHPNHVDRECCSVTEAPDAATPLSMGANATAAATTPNANTASAASTTNAGTMIHLCNMPDLWLARWHESKHSGAIQVTNEQEPDFPVTVGEYVHYTDYFRFMGAITDFGDHMGQWHDPLSFMAVAWLGLCYVPRMHCKRVGAGGGRIGELFLRVLRQPLPDAVNALIWRGTTHATDVSDFERFSARQLVEAGAGDLRAIAAQHKLELIRLTTTDMFWIRFDETQVQGLQHDLIASVEAALNRLSTVEIAARKRDNGMGMLATPSEQDCYDAVKESAHNMREHAKFIRQTATEDNPWRTIHNVEGQQGGNWDAYTRFTSVCEQLSLPYRLEYRCDVNTQEGVMAIVCTTPTAMMFPSTDMVDGSYEDVKSRRSAHAAAYALRLNALMAYNAFTSSLNITNVTVTCNAGSITGDTVLSLRYDRTMFNLHTLPPLISGELDNVELDNDPLGIYRMIDPAEHRLRFNQDRGLSPVDPLAVSDSLLAQRKPLWEDDRPLPPSLRKLLRADTAKELDVMNDDEIVTRAEISEIVAENEDSLLTASIELESVLLRLEDATQPDEHTDEEAADEFAAQLSGQFSFETTQDGAVDFAHGKTPEIRAKTKRLYCERPIMRLLVSLDGNDDSVRYERVPDAMFDAKLLLGRIDRDAGNHDRALSEQRECVALAPTTAQSYIDLSMTYAELDEDFDEASDMLIHALRVAVMPMDIAFCYYRLAYAMWQLGSLDVALACYVKATENQQSAFYENARAEMQELMSIMDEDTQIPTTPQAHATLRAAGIPVAPSDNVVNIVAQAAIELVDAGFPLAADEAVWFLSRITEGDVCSLVSASLRIGADAMV